MRAGDLAVSYAREDVTVGRLMNTALPWLMPAGEQLQLSRQVTVGAEPGVLRIGDERIGTAMGAVRLQLGARVWVVVDVEDQSPIAIVCPDVADARALIAALGLRADRTPIRFQTPAGPGGHELMRSGLALAAVLAVLVVFLALVLIAKLDVFSRAIGGLAGVGALVAAAVALRALGRSVADIGVDGIRVRWVWTTRFVPWSRVASIAQREDGVDVELRSGGRLELVPNSAEHVADIAAHIEEARAEAAKPKDSEDLRLLASGGPVGAADIAALRELGRERSASYRAARVERDTLWRIVEDPAQDGVTRARAAVALSAELDVPQKKRLRVAAEATASPTVRVAIERVVSGANDEHLATALAEIEGEGKDEGEAEAASAHESGRS